MLFSTQVAKVPVPRKSRFRFCDIRVCKWLVPALRCLALPFAVKRNLFLVPLWVFIFGIELPSQIEISVKSSGALYRCPKIVERAKRGTYPSSADESRPKSRIRVHPAIFPYLLSDSKLRPARYSLHKSDRFWLLVRDWDPNPPIQQRNTPQNPKSPGVIL